jgi:hypothetical protein
MMYQATRTFVADYDGDEVEITAGHSRVSGDHPIRAAHPDAFEPAPPGPGMGMRSEIRAQDHNRGRAYTGSELFGDEQRRRAILEAVERGNTEAGAWSEEVEAEEAERRGEKPPTRRVEDGPPHLREARDGAMRTLERHSKADALSSEAVDRVDAVLRGPDAGFGLDAAYIEAAGSEAYERAFAKLIRYGDGASCA